MRMVFPTKRPARLMDELATDVGTFVESFFGDLGQGSSQHQRSGSQHQRMSAPMDVDESADAFWLSLDVPGVKLGDIEIDVHDEIIRSQRPLQYYGKDGDNGRDYGDGTEFMPAKLSEYVVDNFNCLREGELADFDRALRELLPLRWEEQSIIMNQVTVHDFEP